MYIVYLFQSLCLAHTFQHNSSLDILIMFLNNLGWIVCELGRTNCLCEQ